MGGLCSAGRLIDPHPCEFYDAAGRLIYRVDAAGYVTGFSYDGAGRELSQTQYATALTTVPTSGNASDVTVIAADSFGNALAASVQLLNENDTTPHFQFDNNQVPGNSLNTYDQINQSGAFGQQNNPYSSGFFSLPAADAVDLAPNSAPVTSQTEETVQANVDTQSLNVQQAPESVRSPYSNANAYSLNGAPAYYLNDPSGDGGFVGAGGSGAGASSNYSSGPISGFDGNGNPIAGVTGQLQTVHVARQRPGFFSNLFGDLGAGDFGAAGNLIYKEVASGVQSIGSALAYSDHSFSDSLYLPGFIGNARFNLGAASTTVNGAINFVSAPINAGLNAASPGFEGLADHQNDIITFEANSGPGALAIVPSLIATRLSAVIVAERALNTSLIIPAGRAAQSGSIDLDLLVPGRMVAIEDATGDVTSNATPLSYDISKWGEYGLPSDGYFVRTLTPQQYRDFIAGRDFSFGGKPVDGYPGGMGFIGSAEEVGGINTAAGYKDALKLDYEPNYLLEFQLKDMSGLQNVLEAPYAEFVPVGKSGAGYLEFNFPGLNTSNVVNPRVRVLQ